MIAHSAVVQTPTEILPHRTPLVHGVEGGDTTDVGGRETQNLGAGLDAGGRYPALDALHQMEHGEQRRPCLRIPSCDGTQLLQRRIGDLGLGDAVVQARLVEMGDEWAMPNQLFGSVIAAGVSVR
jgi:hypothetical protein